jgi:hypothetical protein
MRADALPQDLAYNAVMRWPRRDSHDLGPAGGGSRCVDVAGGVSDGVGLPDLRRGGVGLICATIFCPPFNYRNRGYTTLTRRGRSRWSS